MSARDDTGTRASPGPSRAKARVWLLAILAAGAVLRLTGIAWDQSHHLHPDERYISMVEEGLRFPHGIREYFDSKASPLNPYNGNHDSFVYGTLPTFLAKAVAQAARRDGYDSTYLFGRALSGIFDLVTVWIVYLLARRLGGRRAGLAAAAFLAFAPLAIQLSHYWTVDSFLTTFAAAALLGSLRIAQGRSGLPGIAATGVAIGLAVACKITALALFAPLGIAILIEAGLGRSRGESGAPTSPRGRFLRIAGRSLLGAAVALVTVRIALPYIFLGWKLDPRWLRDMKNLMTLSKSVAGFPPALQWAGRTPFFPLENFVLWGAAPFFGLAALAGGAVALAGSWRRERRAVLPLLAYAAFVCAYHALTLAKMQRYFYPAYPPFAVFAGLFVAGLAARRSASRLARALPAFLLAGAALCGIAFSSIYHRPVTRITASQWIYRNVPAPARFANETWDDGLPFPMPGYDTSGYAGPAMDLWGPDNVVKAETVVRTLAGSDWIAITSNRVYGNITRLPSVYPMTTAYYRALFEGRLGFERAADFTSYPSLGPIRIPDDRSEEAFTVYDHPRVLLFRKTKEFSEARVRSILLAAIPTVPPTIWDWEKAPRSQRKVSSPIVPGRSAAAEKAAPVPAAPEERGGSWTAAILFYLAAALVGLLALPIVTVCFRNLRDRGAGLARVVGLLVSTYALTALVQGRAIGNGRGAAVAGLLVLAALSAAVLLRRGREIAAFWRANARILVENEVVFLAGFLLFAGMRAFNPEIYWGEKPMDFSILNILVRTPRLPASDPWFAGAPLGYYTFGQETIALLSMLTGISTRYTFNLAFGLLGGATLAGAYSLARNWAGTRRAGIAAAALAVLLGNLAGPREWLTHHRPFDWHYFWATSRVVPETIQEFPFWSLTFADLHSHVFAFPVFLLVAMCALSLVRRLAEPSPRWIGVAGGAAAFGAAAAGQALTNAWDVPLLAGLLVLVAVAAALAPSRRGLAAVVRALFALVISGATAVLLVLPLWVRGGGAPGHGRNVGGGAKGEDILTHFGLFVFLAVAWWLVSGARRLGEKTGRRWTAGLSALIAGAGLAVLAVRAPAAFYAVGVLMFLAAAILFPEEPADRLACGFLATAFFLIFFAERYYIYDRMNTYFKLYLEAWLLFSVALSALVFGRPRRSSFGTWPLPLRGAALVLAAAALFTSVTDARGNLQRNRASLPDGVPPGGPSLDGIAYRERWHPGEYRAVLWLRTALRGTPVVLEAQGPTYQEYGRISMLTGLPTVLGWDYHVSQRGNPPAEIEARREAVRQIYSSPRADAVEGLLRRYHVGYVYVGALERRTYPSGGLAKFAAAKDLFQVAYENPEISIYRVVGGDAEDVVAPQRESLPAPSPETVAAGVPPPSEPEEKPAIAEKASEGVSPWANLKEPRGAAVDSRGRVWIADFGHSRLRVYDKDGGFLGGWGGRGSGSYGFNELCGVAIRGDDLYVADTWNGRVQAFDTKGEWKASAMELYGPRGVAAGPDGRVWVSDTGNGRVVRYESDLTRATPFGGKGSGPTQFNGPVGIAVGPSGNVYVADTGNRRIQVLDPDGGFYKRWPVLAWKDGSEPQVAVDEDENVWVSDPPGNAVLELGPDGRVLNRLTSDAQGRAFSAPTGLALDRKTRMLYVINSGNSSVTIIPLPERTKR